MSPFGAMLLTAPGRRGTSGAHLSVSFDYMETSMAEIRVAPQRRNRTIVWILLIVLVIAAIAAWYFLAGPGAGPVGTGV
jgi:hypothetical protein